MPKIVDHEARREEIAGALWRVIGHVGVAGASVRAVAAEAGCSPGAVRHYFDSQTGLIRFGVELQLSRIPARLQQIVDTLPPGRRRAQALVEQLLPLDAERLAEARVWLAALDRARVDDSLDDLRVQGWHGERHVVRYAVSDLLGTKPPQGLGQPLARADAETVAERAHIFVDGLTVTGATFPDLQPVERQRQLLTAYLDDIGPSRKDVPAARS